MKVVLASESQSRKRALDILGLKYEVHPSAIDEQSVRDADPAALTRKLAEAKAWRVVSAVKDAVVVSGDAVVAKDGKIFEKPRDSEEAAAFLRELSDSAFQFLTSLVVIRSDTRRLLSTVEISQIKFRWKITKCTTTSADIRFCAMRGLSKARVFCASRTQSQAATTS